MKKKLIKNPKNKNHEVEILESLEKENKRDVATNISVGILNCFPLIGDFAELTEENIKNARHIAELHQQKVVIEFLKGIMEEKVSEKECEEILKQLSNDSSDDEELRLMAIFSSTSEKLKGKLYAKIFVAVAKGYISCSEYRDYTELLVHLLYSDIKVVLEKWESCSEGALYVKRDDKEFSRLSSFGIGEEVFLKDKNNDINYSEVTIYYYDEYSQKFLNILCDKEVSKVAGDRLLFNSYSEVSSQIPKPMTADDIIDTLNDADIVIDASGNDKSDDE